ncbi:hypothetical protein [Acrocarpospora sp. B8E8]|uniref:hypothetical protein n=1 Tax=Acrocarpospora sp. B8E8 TaxID=3153572 RepID=UPI00325FDEA6
MSKVVVIGVVPNHPNVVVVPLRDDLAVTPTLLAVRDPGTGLIADVASMTGLSRTRLLDHVGEVDHKTLAAIGSGIMAFLDL